jgi:hypothetical protein
LYCHDEVTCEVDQDDADRIARLLDTRGAVRPRVRIDNLVANATVAERWSDFKEPGWTPEPEPPPPPVIPSRARSEQLILGEESN